MSINGDLRPLERALDEARAPVTFFFRDDDGGWEDDRLRPLVDLHARHGIPLDLALIPDAVDARLARDLLRRVSAGQALGLHQHGRTHVNHERTGRKCEFGASRKAVDQYTDIESGKLRLADLFGAHADPIFTPPWNRCTQVTVVSLQALGFRALSRDAGAEELDLLGLCELPVSVDWCGHAGARPTLAQLAQRLARATAAGEPVGVMLHHAVMSGEALDVEEALLALLASHGNARCVHMRDLCAQAHGAEAGL
jgi:hypothetical protein